MKNGKQDGAIAVVIPCLDAGRHLRRQLPMLAAQSLRPSEVLVIDSQSGDDTVAVAHHHAARVQPIRRRDFNHGGTRNLGLSLTGAPFVCFLTQDALPADRHFLARLVAPLAQGSGAAFARQLAYPTAKPGEVFTRAFNYPERSEHRGRDARRHLGVRATFFSNVASAVRRDAFEAVGRFPDGLIMNEDVVLCARLLDAGWPVDYVAEARVYHSHDYSLSEQCRRFFDIGVFHARFGHLVGTKLGGAGRRFVSGQMRHLVATGHWDLIPYHLLEAAAKYLAFQAGSHHRALSHRRCRRWSLHRGWWLRPRP